MILRLQLVDQKLVSLEDPIGKYVPGLPNGDSATLRMLASMTNGIPPYTDSELLLDAYFSHPQTVFTPQQQVGYVRGEPERFTAGRQMSYSNTNTLALGMVIEQMTGMPFA